MSVPCCGVRLNHFVLGAIFNASLGHCICSPYSLLQVKPRSRRHRVVLCAGPSLIPNVGGNSNTQIKCSISTSRSPSPTRALLDGHVVPPKGEPREKCADE